MKGVAMESVTEAVERFLEAADWLTDEDAPAVVMLKNCAQKLDEQYQAAMVQQARMLFGMLRDKKTVSPVADEAEEFLASL